MNMQQGDVFRELSEASIMCLQNDYFLWEPMIVYIMLESFCMYFTFFILTAMWLLFKSLCCEIPLLLFNSLEVDFYILGEYCHFTIQFLFRSPMSMSCQTSQYFCTCAFKGRLAAGCLWRRLHIGYQKVRQHFINFILKNLYGPFLCFTWTLAKWVWQVHI